MDLSQPSIDNIRFMIEQIKDKLRMANVDAMKAEHFDTSNYEDIQFMYDMVMKRQNISANEMQAIAAELGNLRNV
ncbi:MAG TPA: DUF1128 domain-containing protein [Savagea sp.]